METSALWTGCLFVCLLSAGCGGGGSGDQAPSRSTAEELQRSSPVAEAVLRRHRETFQLAPAIQPAHGVPSRSASASSPQPILAPGVIAEFVRRRDRVRPAPPHASAPTRPPADTSFPLTASGAFELRDVVSGLSISVGLASAQDSSVQVASGYLIYPAAYEGAADLLQRPYSSGTEQSIAFASKPSSERVTYDVALGTGVAGVRFVANTVEFLDSHGAPRLRMAPPFLAGAQSTDAWPTVSVAGCAVDSNPAPPWDRAVVSPRSSRCSVVVDWSQSSIQYPALLDPSWTVGSTMAVPRMHHASAIVTANGRQLALAFGGYAYTSTLASAELFDQTTQTWAQTGSLVADVSYVPAVALNATTALAVGGFRVSAAGGTEYDGVQAYNAATGQWTIQGHLGSAREEHTATLLANGNVLVTGGFGAYPQVFANALLYNPSTGTATPAGTMQSARGDHTATLLANGQVLVVDGLGANAVAQSAADLYNPGTNSWSTVAPPPLPPRFSHVAPLLPNGQVLIAGGDQLTTGIAQTLGTALYSPTSGTWTTGPATSGSHYTGTAVVLTQGTNAGKALLAGGDTSLNEVELFDPTALTWTSLAPLLTGRDFHIAALLQTGVLLAGGSDSNGNILSSAELYQPDAAATAPQWPAQATLTVTAASTTSVTLTWPAAVDPRGVGSYTVYENGQVLATVSGSTLSYTVTGLSPGAAMSFAVQAVDPSGVPSGNGPTAFYTLVAPPIDTTVSTQLAPATSFLYSGSNPIQTGVDAGTIVAATQAVVRGAVYSVDAGALPGVTVTVANHPELGSTVSRSDGHHDMAVNGGGTMRIHYAMPNYLPAERVVQAPWQDYVTVPDVTLIPLDTNVTPVDVSGTAAAQVARGSVSTDSSGSRQATVLLPPATTATMTLPTGTTTPTALHVRATEYTVGSTGPSAMPASLPPNSAYTYAVELSSDEAISAGATGTSFSQPLAFYLENFLSFPVGTSVPSGYYDPSQGAWVPSTTGIVLQVLSVDGGAGATVDLTGSGMAATSAQLSAIGITATELEQIASLYAPGQTLWRVPISHFTAWDFNWAGGDPGDAGPPPNPTPLPDLLPGPGPCTQQGSIIGCQSQALGQVLPVADTPYTLHYESDRQRGRQSSMQIQLSGPTLAGNVEAIALEVDVAGRVFNQAFAPTPNLSTTFTWDGTDTYGRFLQGGQPVTIKVGNQYNTAMYANIDGFGLPPNATLTTSPTRQMATVSVSANSTLDPWDDLPRGLGGWTLNVHHAYDVGGKMIRFGDGTDEAPASMPNVITTVAGTGSYPEQWPPAGDGGPATQANIYPLSITVGPDGSIYFGQADACVRKVTPDGVLHTIAGQCNANTEGYGGDGGPATSARLSCASAVALGPDGSLYVADCNNNRIRRIDTSGIITTVVGTGAQGYSGDGGPAVKATLHGAYGLDVGPDGSIYIADSWNNVIRQVTPDGIIRTVVGTGTNAGCTCGISYGPARAASLQSPRVVKVGPNGGLYFVEWVVSSLRYLAPNGTIQNLVTFPNDLPENLGFAADGSAYVATLGSRIAKVAPGGTLTYVAGSLNDFGFSGDQGPAAQAVMNGPSDIRVAPDGSVYIADKGNLRIRRIGSVLPAFSLSTNPFQFGSEDGRQVYVFDGNGRHLQTIDAFTGATLFAFGYDTSGRLSTVTDVHGNITQVNRNASGNPVSIVGPFGQATTLTTDANGYLASVTDPASQTTQFTYSSNGLMATMTDARGGLHQFSYDGAGRLTEDQEPTGGSKTLTRTEVDGGFSVNVTTALGTQSTYQTTMAQSGTFSRTNTLPSGLQTSLAFTTAGTTTVTTPDGTIVTTTQTPDPRYGSLAPVNSVTTTLPSGLTSTQTVTRSAALDGGALVSLTEQTNLSGNTWTRAYNASANTWTMKSPVGRQTVTTLDAFGEPLQTAISNSNIAPVVATYDTHGRVQTMTQGPSRTWGFAYDAFGYPNGTTDPLGHLVSSTNDLIGRPLQTALADGRLLASSYDGDSNLTSETLPSLAVHDFSYNPIDQLASYTPPSLGAGLWSTQYTYDLDGRPTLTTRPDGLTIAKAYDSAGRLHTTTYPQGTITRTYNPTTGQLATLTAPSGETLSYAYNGFLTTGVTWSGPVAGAVTFGFDSSLRLDSRAVNGQALALGYDADSLLTQSGSLTLTRDPQSGRLTGTSLGNVTDAYTYDTNGLLLTYVASYSGSPLYTESIVQRDLLGRITQKSETIGTTTHVWGYTYDATGRLTDVTEDGAFASHYGYDADDNRTTFTNSSGSITPTYDAQDRLLTYGATSYTYTANGELASKTDGTGTTTTTYDVFGNLLHVGLSSGTAIDYVVDGANRRVGKKVNSTLSTGFLYQDALNVVAQLDGSGNVLATFVFGSKPNVPDYYINSTGTFRILSDHLGSPRLIVNVSNGSAVEEIDYDEFGNVTRDTVAGGLTPFGFAGGLYDPQTGLVRFGARDYDPHVGRWTSKDPIRFRGGMNLYGYSLANPVNAIDPTGLAGTFNCDFGVGNLDENGNVSFNLIPTLGCGFTYCITVCSSPEPEPPTPPSPPDPNPVCGLPTDSSSDTIPATVNIGVRDLLSGSVSTDLCTYCFTVGVGVGFPVGVSWPL